MEMQDRLPIANNLYPISTIYIGGGTPSTLQVEHLRAIVEAIRREARGDEAMRRKARGERLKARG